MKKLLLALVCALTICGCGGSGKGSTAAGSSSTKTATTLATTLENDVFCVNGKDSQDGEPCTPQSGNSGPSQAGQDFCDSAKGDAVNQIQPQIEAAYNAPDLSKMLRTERKALALASKAPRGAYCVVQMLTYIRQIWNIGAGNFSGIDTVAKARAIRAFQRKHGFLTAQ